MAHPSEEIRLGDRTWILRPLTCKQVEEIEPWVEKAKSAPERSIAFSLQVIAIALSRDHAMHAAQLWDIEGDKNEINDAALVILRMGGWIQREADSLGEAEAPMTGAEPGLGSEAA